MSDGHLCDLRRNQRHQSSHFAYERSRRIFITGFLGRAGKEWKKLADCGATLGTLARKFGCSKSHVRDLIMLASLPRDLQQAYVQGRLGRKKVLALARDTKQVQISDETGSELQEQPKQNSDLIMSESERQAYIAQRAKLVVDWLRSTTLSPCHWEAFFRQIDLQRCMVPTRYYSRKCSTSHKNQPGGGPLASYQDAASLNSELGFFYLDVINKHIDGGALDSDRSSRSGAHEGNSWHG